MFLILAPVEKPGLLLIPYLGGKGKVNNGQGHQSQGLSAWRGNRMKKGASPPPAGHVIFNGNPCL